MKKRLFSLVLAFCLIIPCMFVFTACDKDKKPEKPTYIEVTTIDELKSALTNTIDNDVIVLNASLDLKDVNDNTALKIEEGKHVLDLNGYTLIGVDNGSDSWHAIDLRGAETQLRILDSSEDKTGTIVGRCYGIQVSRGATLTIDGGNYVCTTNDTFNQAVVVYGGTLVINDGTFVANVYETIFGAAHTWDSVEYSNTITINGGAFNSNGTEASEYGLFYFEGANQIVHFNGGTFNNNNLQFVVCHENTVQFINNAGIAEELIESWEA